MTKSYDVAVVGLGAMGSAAAYHLARRGMRVLGLDRFSPPHTLGSTHGKTRIIREAYYEHPQYVPLVQRAYECWEELEHESGRELFRKTGGLMIGPAEGVLVAGARASAREHGLPHEKLTAAEIRRRFPALRPDEEMVGLFEPRAGLLFPEQCVAMHLELARRHGAELRYGERLGRWRANGGGVSLTTDASAYEVDRLILAAGPWTGELLAELEVPLQVERQLFHWFEPASHLDIFRANRCPIALWEYAPDRIVATFPEVGHGVKVGIHHEGETVDPDTVRRQITPEEDERVRALVRRLIPEADGRLVDSAVCLYTNTPDHHFLIDLHPFHPQVVIASPCSGHGFKFASAIGEVLADLATTGASRFDLTPFRLGRWSGPGRPAARSPLPAANPTR